MPTLEVGQLVEATGGALLAGEPTTKVTSFGIDTRTLTADSAFFALAGARTDGHEFLDRAAAAGAVAAVVEHPPKDPASAPRNLVRVDDVRSALTRCGAWVRDHHRDPCWIALTGSNGKTTTKEMIAAGLSASHRVHRTPGNYNNDLGVPLTLLGLPDDTEFAVLELAMNAPGEIADLARLTDPDIGLITNVRAVHMSAFRSLDDIAAAKGELFAVLRDDAVAVVNLDDVQVRIQSARHVGPQVTFGQHSAADIRLEGIENRFLPGAALRLRHDGKVYSLQLRIGGAHAAHDALAAIATIVAAGDPLEAAAERIELLEAGAGRGRVHRLASEIVLVDESYNSSPPALASVLETLRVTEAAGRRVLVLGDMLELGSMEVAFHREAGRRAAAAKVDLLMAVGSLARETAESARRSGVGQVHHYDDAGACAESIGDFLRGGDVVVVKGSRGMKMERVVHALVESFGGGR